MQVIKLVCGGHFQNNTDACLQDGVICFLFSKCLSIDPDVCAFSDAELSRIRADLCGSSPPDIGAALSVLYQQVSTDTFANRMHLLPRPANWVCWATEKICAATATHDLKLFVPASAAQGPAGGSTASPSQTLVASISPPAAPFIHRAVTGSLLCGLMSRMFRL